MLFFSLLLLLCPYLALSEPRDIFSVSLSKERFQNNQLYRLNKKEKRRYKRDLDDLLTVALEEDNTLNFKEEPLSVDKETTPTVSVEKNTADKTQEVEQPVNIQDETETKNIKETVTEAAIDELAEPYQNLKTTAIKGTQSEFQESLSLIKNYDISTLISVLENCFYNAAINSNVEVMHFIAFGIPRVMPQDALLWAIKVFLMKMRTAEIELIGKMIQFMGLSQKQKIEYLNNKEGWNFSKMPILELPQKTISYLTDPKLNEEEEPTEFKNEAMTLIQQAIRADINPNDHLDFFSKELEEFTKSHVYDFSIDNFLLKSAQQNNEFAFNFFIKLDSSYNVPKSPIIYENAFAAAAELGNIKILETLINLPSNKNVLFFDFPTQFAKISGSVPDIKPTILKLVEIMGMNEDERNVKVADGFIDALASGTVHLESIQNLKFIHPQSMAFIQQVFKNCVKSGYQHNPLELIQELSLVE